MANNRSGLAHLELIKQRQLSKQDTEILGAFALALQPAVPNAALEAAYQLDSLCPPLQDEQDARDYLWTTWEIMLDIARSLNVDDNIQACLVGVLEELYQCAKGELDTVGSGPKQRVWRDLPMLPDCFDASYTDPTAEGVEFTAEAAQRWHKLSTFGARCLAAGVLGPYVQAMYAVKSALEQDLSALPVAEMADWRIKVACAWLTRGAKQLLWWARENQNYGNVEDETNYVARGPLYEGPAVMCFERWHFWLDRLQELVGQESRFAEDTLEAAVEAARIMSDVERSLLYTRRY